MLESADDLIEEAQLSAKLLGWEWGFISVEDLCATAIEDFFCEFDSSNIGFGFECYQKNLAMMGHAAAIRALLKTLLKNAISYSAGENIEFSVSSVEIEMRPFVKIQIGYAGSSIPKNLIERISTIFYGYAGSTNSLTKTELKVANAIVSAHGGSLKFEILKEAGAMVTLLFRADLAQADCYSQMKYKP